VPTLNSVERSIARVEGFNVRFTTSNGRKVRSDVSGLSAYPYVRGARDGSVAAWRKARIQATYPEYSVQVLDGAGRAVHGKTLLSTVRNGYA
jgi:ribosomal protein L34